MSKLKILHSLPKKEFSRTRQADRFWLSPHMNAHGSKTHVIERKCMFDILL